MAGCLASSPFSLSLSLSLSLALQHDTDGPLSQHRKSYMSGDRSLSIAQARTLHPFRLLELPPDLVDQLTGPNPPRLDFKSTKPCSGPGPAEAEAALCTPDKTYRVREVQTSNSVYVAHAPPDAGAVTCIAKCTSYLELLFAPPSSAVAYLEAALPVHHNDNTTSSTAGSQRAVFDDIPLSETQCLQAWTELAAFQTGEPLQSFRPSNHALLGTWTEICACATEKSIGLSAPLPGVQLNELAESAQGVPSELVRAVLDKLMTVDSRATVRDCRSDLQLDRSRVVKWVGSILVATRLPTEQDDLLCRWKDLLPEAWREDAQMSLLTAGDVQVTHKSSTAAQSGTADPAPVGTKRKWHEKFKNARRT